MASGKPSKELQALLAECDPAVAKLALRLRSLVVGESSTATEIVFDAGYAISIMFSFTDRWQDAFCHIAVYSRHVNLAFNQGAKLPDPDHRLKGSGKQLRHIQVRTEEHLQNKDLLDFLRLAIEHSRATLESKPPKN